MSWLTRLSQPIQTILKSDMKWTATAEHMGVFPHPMGGHLRAAARRSPAADRIAHPSEPGFIFKHQAQGPVRVPSRHGRHFGLEFF